ncbi:hypothetical protein HDE_06663 [Halotydeus destructor]|nr:hypothetical protein HDE_06663 [Halotydeus destructor]
MMADSKLMRYTLKLFYVAYIVACTMGCTYQLSKISNEFFRYLVVTDMTMNIPNQLDCPAVSLCFLYSDLLPQNVTEKQAANLTIADILTQTPNRSLVTECKIRSPGRYDYEELKGQNCSDQFDIVKYFVQENICYMHSAKNNGSYAFRTLTGALQWPAMIYHFSLNLQLLNASRVVKPIIHFHGQLPHMSHKLANRFIIRGSGADDEVSKYRLSSTYSLVTMIQLPAPYITNCRDYGLDGFNSEHDCQRQCLVARTVEYVNKVPFTLILKDKLEYRHLQYEDLINYDKMKLILKAQDECNQLCWQKNCTDVSSLTKSTAEPSSAELAVTFEAPRELFFYLTNLPKLGAIEYGIYCLSVLGTWFGLSMVQLNPFRSSIYASIKDRFRNVQRRRSEPLLELFTGHCECGCCLATRMLLRKEIKQELDAVLGSFRSNSSVQDKRRPLSRFNYAKVDYLRILN